MKPVAPLLAADCVVFDDAGRVLLIRRGHEPFKGMYAFPGGFVEVGETVEQAALRELREETGIEGRILKLIGVYSEPKRDPRHHSVAVVYLVERISGESAGGDDAESAEFVSDWRDLDLAFDHNQVLADALKLRG